MTFKGTFHAVIRSVLPKAVMIAVFATVLAIVFDVAELEFEMDGKNYAVYSSALAFLVVFRNGKAYGRWWDGVCCLTQLKTDWLDACAQLAATTLCSPEPEEQVTAYVHTITRLFSILTCIAFKHIADMKDEKFEILNMEGLDDETKNLLWNSPERPRHLMPLVEQWILNTVHRGIQENIVVAPAPIVNRFFTGLHSGMVLVKKCQLISFTEFPTPYSIMVNSLLVVHLFYTAAFASSSQPNLMYMCPMVFFSTFAFWAINLIAMEIEHPFGDDVNDINLHAEQEEINHHLMILLDPRSRHKPGCGNFSAMVGSYRKHMVSTEILRDEGNPESENSESHLQPTIMNKTADTIGIVGSEGADRQKSGTMQPEDHAASQAVTAAIHTALQGLSVKLADDSLVRDLAMQQKQLATNILDHLKQQDQRNDVLNRIQEQQSQLLCEVAESCSRLFKEPIPAQVDLSYTPVDSRHDGGLVQMSPCISWSATLPSAPGVQVRRPANVLRSGARTPGYG